MKQIMREFGKAVIISAPSGAGKTTIVKQLLNLPLQLEFSVSACSRPMREGEKDGVDYNFLSPEEFRKRVEAGDFVEWQEVYPGSFYGTLNSELDRIWSSGHHVLFEVDVFGGINLKKIFGDKAISLFIAPPSMEELENRLRRRGLDTEESIKKRLSKARLELEQQQLFDGIIVNNTLEIAVKEAETQIKSFLQKEIHE